MRFKEFIFKEECDLFERCDQINNEWLYDESLFDILKGGYNVLKGSARAGAGAMTVGDEILSKMVGQGQQGRLSRGLSGIKTGGWEVLHGLRQAVVGSPRNATVSDIRPDKKEILSTPEKRVEEPNIEKPKVSVERPVERSKVVEKPKKPSKDSLGWAELVDQYKSARDRGEKNRIQAVMAIRYPRRYKVALEKAREMARSRQ